MTCIPILRYTHSSSVNVVSSKDKTPRSHRRTNICSLRPIRRRRFVEFWVPSSSTEPLPSISTQSLIRLVMADCSRFRGLPRRADACDRFESCSKSALVRTTKTICVFATSFMRHIFVKLVNMQPTS